MTNVIPLEGSFDAMLLDQLDDKVDKVTGKGLSTEDYSSAEKSKLAGIASGATANDTDANLKNRTNHTGTQAASTITGLATVATTGSYNDLSNKPSIPSNTDGLTEGSTNLYFTAARSRAAARMYNGTTAKDGYMPYVGSVTVGSGVGVFHLTDTGLSGGTALFPNGPVLKSVNAFVNDANASYQYGYAWSNSNKTLTVTVNKFTTANILSGILGQAAANGAEVNVTVFGN